jgi:hypothetical protein
VEGGNHACFCLAYSKTLGTYRRKELRPAGEEMKVYQEQRLGESEWAERIGAAVGAVLAVGVIWFVVTLVFSLA